MLPRIPSTHTVEKRSMLPGRLNFATSVIARVSKTGALSLLGFVLAYWTWAWCAPAALARAADVAEPVSGLANAGNLFGRSHGDAPATAPTGLAIKLLGVIAAGPGGSGYALLQLGAGKTQVVRAGGYLAPGILLEQVLPQQVILQRNGSRETLVWPHAQTPAAATSVPVR